MPFSYVITGRPDGRNDAVETRATTQPGEDHIACRAGARRHAEFSPAERHADQRRPYLSEAFLDAPWAGLVQLKVEG